jgi:hypothetical protein
MAIRLTKEQFQAFEDSYAQDWYEEAAQKLMNLYPDYINAFGAKLQNVRKFCVEVHLNAKAVQIHSQKDVLKLAVLSLILGLNFRDDPRFRKALENSLDRTHIPENRRIILLSEFVQDWVQAGWSQNKMAEPGERLASYIIQNTNELTSASERRENIYTLFPSAFSDQFEVCAAFFRLTEQHCAEYGMHHGVLRFAYLGCSVTFGVKWFDDPLLENLKAVFSTSKTPNELGEGIRSFYKGFA